AEPRPPPQGRRRPRRRGGPHVVPRGGDPAPGRGRRSRGMLRLMTPIPIQVYGINLLVRLMPEGPADVRVHCPKGSPIRYGEVVARGDGLDEGANAFREMPDLKTIVVFEASAEEGEGQHS